ncbi:MAG: hypothetical protein ACPL8I_00300 [Chloroflexaceae bacterium]
MGDTTVVVALLIALVFGVMLIGSIAITRKDRAKKAQAAQALGLAPVAQPDAALAERIFALHRPAWGTATYELRNVWRRPLADGELFLFDLVDTSGDGDSITAHQAVAIRSATLHLPPFMFYPKVDTQQYALGGLANRIVEWAVARVGQPVSFPDYPAFAARYTVTSDDPPAVRRFFDERLANYFATTRFYTLHAAGNLFVFAEIGPGLKTGDQSHLARRIDRALEMYHLFRQEEPVYSA